MTVPPWFFYLILLILGLVLGSFYNVCIYRLPREESIVWPGSHCPHCHHPLSLLDNLPLVSFLLLKGACRYCHAPISYQYPLVEVLSGCLTLLLGWKYGFSWAFLQGLILVGALLIVSIIDFIHLIIPEIITLPGIFVGLGFSWLLGSPGLYPSIIGLLLGSGTLFILLWAYKRITQEEGMGFGDVELLAMIGAFIGWKGVIVTIFLGSLIGSFVGLPIVIWKKDRKYQFPFGLFLSLGALIHLFFGTKLLNWYFG